MKKIIKRLVAGTIGFCTITNGFSQVVSPDVTLASTNAMLRQLKVSDDLDDGAIIPSNKQNLMDTKASVKSRRAAFRIARADMKANKYLTHKFKKPFNANWSYDHKSVWATFVADSVTTEVAFTKRGNRWLHTLKSYDESKMPPAIKYLVNKNYPNKTITAVLELKERDETYISYFVRLEDASGFKDVVVYNGETAVYNEGRKSIDRN